MTGSDVRKVEYHKTDSPKAFHNFDARNMGSLTVHKMSRCSLSAVVMSLLIAPRDRCSLSVVVMSPETEAHLEEEITKN